MATTFEKYFNNNDSYVGKEWMKPYVRNVIEKVKSGVSGLTEYIQNLEESDALNPKEVSDIFNFMMYLIIIYRDRRECGKHTDENKKIYSLMYVITRPFPFHKKSITYNEVILNKLNYERIQNLMKVSYSFGQYDIMENFLKYGYEPNREMIHSILWACDSNIMELVLSYSPLNNKDCLEIWEELKQELEEESFTFSNDEYLSLKSRRVKQFAQSYLC